MQGEPAEPFAQTQTHACMHAPASHHGPILLLCHLGQHPLPRALEALELEDACIVGGQVFQGVPGRRAEALQSPVPLEPEGAWGGQHRDRLSGVRQCPALTSTWRGLLCPGACPPHRGTCRPRAPAGTSASPPAPAPRSHAHHTAARHWCACLSLFPLRPPPPQNWRRGPDPHGGTGRTEFSYEHAPNSWKKSHLMLSTKMIKVGTHFSFKFF